MLCEVFFLPWVMSVAEEKRHYAINHGSKYEKKKKKKKNIRSKIYRILFLYILFFFII